MRTYDAPHACTQAKITYRQLDYWTRIGLLATVDGSHGSGIGREWSSSEVEIATLMRRLIGIGIKMGPAHEYARALASTRCLAGVVAGPGITIMVGDESSAAQGGLERTERETREVTDDGR